jgi:hypothetical protein
MKKILIGLMMIMVAVSSFATAFDVTTGSGITVFPASESGKMVTMKIAINCATINMATNDTFKLLSIPAGSKVESVDLIVGTAEGSASTVDIGDSSASGTYISGGDINSAAGTMLYGNGSTGTTTVAVKKYYSTANYIILKSIDGNSAFKGTLVVNVFKATK